MNIVVATAGTDDNGCAAAAGGVPRGADRRGLPNDLEDVVETDSACQLFDGVAQVGVGDCRRRTELERDIPFSPDPVDSENRGGTGQPRPLDDVDPDTPAADYYDAGTWLHLGGVYGRSHTGHHRTTDQRGDLERHVAGIGTTDSTGTTVSSAKAPMPSPARTPVSPWLNTGVACVA